VRYSWKKVGRGGTREKKRHFRQWKMAMYGHWQEQKARFAGGKVPHVTAQLGYTVMRTLVQYPSTTRISLRDGNNSNEELFWTFRRVTLYKDIEVSEIPSASIFRIRSWNWHACSSVLHKDFCRFPQRAIILPRPYHGFFLSKPFLFVIDHYHFSSKLSYCGYWPAACKMTQ
jgi:hypothetical protein